MFTLRPINHADVPAAEVLLVRAYGWTPDGPEILAWRRTHGHRDLKTALGAFHSKALIGFVEYQPVPIQVGQRAVPGAVVANLAVDSDWRRRKVATRLMDRQLEQLNDRGIALYTGAVAWVPLMRSLGWEFGSMVLRHEFQPHELVDQLRDTPTSGHAVSLTVTAIPDLDAIYQRNVAGRFGAIARTRSWWVHRILTDATGRRRRDVTGWTSVDDRLEGYAVVERHENSTRIVELHALTRDAYVGLLAHLAQVHDTSCLRWSAPIDDLLPLVANQPYRLHPQLEPDKMFRVVRVGAVLEAALGDSDLRNHPDTPLTVTIRDDHASWNARTWCVRADQEDGVKVEPVHGAMPGTTPASTVVPAAVRVGTLAAMIGGLRVAIPRDGGERWSGRHVAGDADDIAVLAGMLRPPAPSYCREDL